MTYNAPEGFDLRGVVVAAVERVFNVSRRDLRGVVCRDSIYAVVMSSVVVTKRLAGLRSRPELI
jgi:hypothetical protein